jgi:hypothetical protein
MSDSVPRRPKPRVYQEDAKTRQTSHWDWDYLPLETLERLARQKQPASRAAGPRQDPLNRRRLAWVCIAAGALLLAGLMAVGVYIGQTAV